MKPKARSNVLPVLAVTMGCPSGIGPEVVAVAASSDAAAQARLLVIGDHAVLMRAVEARAKTGAVKPEQVLRINSPEQVHEVPAGMVALFQPTEPLRARDCLLGKPSKAGGASQLAWVDEGCDLVKAGLADALVTGPVSKEAIVRSKVPGSEDFLGHTEHLQRRLRAREVVMAFHADKLTTALVTTHLPLASVPKAITPARVATATFWLSSLLAALALEGAQGGAPKMRGTRRVRVPKVVVAGLNPHAGEGGLLGREETSKLVPGMTKARERLQREGLSVELLGPVPAESAFRLAAAGAFDGVVAMYHDQATIPMKLVGFGEAVNVSLGLPIVRTSVDHGTAYDRAPLFQADARGMVEALALAGRLVRARHLGASPRA